MNKLLLILFMILLLMNNYCNKETKKDEFSVDKPYYYGHQNKYTIPNTHSKPLTIEEAKNKTVYYKVYYNNKNQVFKTIRYYSNSIDFKKIYHYRNNE